MAKKTSRLLARADAVSKEAEKELAATRRFLAETSLHGFVLWINNLCMYAAHVPLGAEPQ